MKPRTEMFRARRPETGENGIVGDPAGTSPGCTLSRLACAGATIGALNRTRKTMLAAALPGAALLSLGPASAQAALPAGNLIVNGDAETGPSGEGGQVFRPP